MPRNVTGVMLLPASSVNPPVPGATIISADYQAEQVDIAAEITNSLDRLGRAPMQANLPMGAFNLVNAGGIAGRVDGSSAAAGMISENVTYNVVTPSSVSSNVNSTMAQIAITPGRWIVTGSCSTAPAGATTTSSFQFWLSIAPAGSASYPGSYAQTNAALAAGQPETLNWMTGQVISVAATTQLYFVAKVVFAGGTMAVLGSGGAIRLM